MSLDNPLWGAPGTHCELLKLGIEESQATVGRAPGWNGRVVPNHPPRLARAKKRMGPPRAR
jgi:hypothetical protein